METTLAVCRDLPFVICGHCGGPLPAEDEVTHSHEECRPLEEL